MKIWVLLFKSRERDFLWSLSRKVVVLFYLILNIVLPRAWGCSRGNAHSQRHHSWLSVEETQHIPLLLCPRPRLCQGQRVAAVSGQWQGSGQLRIRPREVRSGKSLDHNSSMPPAHVPFPHLTSFTKHKLKDTIIQNFKTMVNLALNPKHRTSFWAWDLT